MTFITRRLRERDERGVTLVEVLVTTLVLGIVTMTAFDFLDRTSRIAVRTDAHARVEDDTQRVLRTVTQHLRGALPVTGSCAGGDGQSPALITGPQPYDNCVQFSVPRTTQGFDGCRRTDFVIGLAGSGDDKQLVLNRREHTGTTTTCTAGAWQYRRVLLTNIRNVGHSKAMFTWYGKDGAQVTGSAVPGASSVRVRLLVRYRRDAAPIELSSVAALRNNIGQ